MLVIACSVSILKPKCCRCQTHVSILHSISSVVFIWWQNVGQKIKAKPLHNCPISFSGKIGYGTVSESLACKKPLVFVRRDHFNEEPFLRKMLEVHPTLRRLPLSLLFVYYLLLTFGGMTCVNWEFLQFYRGGVEMNRRDFLSGRWAPYLERALVIKPCYNGALNGGQVNRLFFY